MISETFGIGKEEKQITVCYNSKYACEGHDGVIDSLPYYKISILLTSGIRAKFVSGASLEAKAGDVLTICPKDAHYGQFFRSGIHKYLDFCIPSEIVDVANEEIRGLLSFLIIDKSRCIYLSDNGREEVLNIVNRIVTLLCENPANKRLLLSAYFVLLCDFIGNACKTSETRYTEKMPELLFKAIEYMEYNFNLLNSAHTVAEYFGYSERRLTDIFKKYCGVTAYEYLVSVKLKNAKMLLDLGENVTTACFDSGFTNYSHFIQLFKKKYGKTPLKYQSLKNR